MRPFETLAQDTGYAIRIMRQNPGFATIAILSLALGIGANTAIFTLIDTVLLRSLPVRDPQQLVAFAINPRSTASLLLESRLRVCSRLQQIVCGRDCLRRRRARRRVRDPR